LTDERFFNGSLGDLEIVAALTHSGQPPVPVLRKDFVIDERQIVEARAAGADAILLIVAALSDARLAALLDVARSYELSTLVEIHDAAELDRALAVDATLVGINNRDLRSFTVDLATSERLASAIPAHVTIVGESGIASREDIDRLQRAGIHAVLVGESLMRAADRTRALRDLRP
jgi:indole-3-glycerol phosphate synthase